MKVQLAAASHDPTFYAGVEPWQNWEEARNRGRDGLTNHNPVLRSKQVPIPPTVNLPYHPVSLTQTDCARSSYWVRGYVGAREMAWSMMADSPSSANPTASNFTFWKRHAGRVRYLHGTGETSLQGSPQVIPRGPIVKSMKRTCFSSAPADCQ